jgi:hypothetical protein
MVFTLLFALSCSGKKQQEPKGKRVVYVEAEEGASFPEFVNSLPFYELKMKRKLVGKHPRLFFTRQDIPIIRQKGKTTNLWFKDKIKKDHGRYFNLPIPTTRIEMQSQSEGMFAWGWWRLMGLNIVYLVEQDTYYRNLAHKWVMEFCRYKSWRRGKRSDLSDSDLMSGVAATYDILYDEFTPAERDTIRQVLLKNLEFLYSAFMTKTGDLYWQRDFQNNHHWSRVHALLIASAAIYGDDPEHDSKKYLNYAYSQCREMLRWLPEDGTCHEGPGYWAFGHKWIIRTFDCLEHITGEDYFQEHPYFKNAMYFKIHLTTSNLKNSLYFGDAHPGLGTGLYVFYRMATEFNNGHFQYYAERIRQEVNPEALFEQAWGTLWYNADIKPTPLSDLPLSVFFPDMDLLVVRSNWDDNATVFGIKCGPPGGYLMNELRFQKEGKDKWANTAHDHPDQNHFILYANGKYWADDDGYPKGGNLKMTSSHNTLLVDGKGQPKDGAGWQQPFGMDSTGFCQDVWYSGSSAIFIGDASRCYDPVERYLRYAAFINGSYLILVDDIVGKGKHDYELRFHRDGKWKKDGPNQFRVSGKGDWMGLKVLMPKKIVSEFLPANRKYVAKPSLALKVRQQEKARVVSLLVPSNADITRLKQAALKQQKGSLIISAPGKTTDDLLIYRLENKDQPYKGKEISGDFSNLLAGKDKGSNGYTVLLAMNCSHLEINGQPYLVSPIKINYCRTRDQAGINVDLGHQFKKEAKNVQVHLGGFKSGTEYIHAINAGKGSGITSDKNGVLALTVPLKEKVIYSFK